MPLDDRTLRPVPDREIFPDADVRTEVLESLSDEIARRGEGDGDPGAFALLDATRRALVRLRGAQDQADGGHTHALLLFHAWHLGTRGGRRFLATVPVCRWAVEAGEAAGRDGGAWAEQTADGSGEAPGGSGAGPGGDAGLSPTAYVQLPRHLFWVRESAEDRPRSLDGFFWTRTGETLHLLGVVDPQSTEGGVEVLPLPGVPLSDREVWMSEAMREEGEDFESSIPGAELERMYELRTAGELLKLAARLDRFLARAPHAVADPATAPDGGTGAGDGAGADGGPGAAPTYHRILLTRD